MVAPREFRSESGVGWRGGRPRAERIEHRLRVVARALAAFDAVVVAAERRERRLQRGEFGERLVGVGRRRDRAGGDRERPPGVLVVEGVESCVDGRVGGVGVGVRRRQPVIDETL
ncbi:hypothetical protein [Haloferax sp. ATB1]|uniref:hypothetical protein n=1 Tax=Haloferax sp. ATB1 TaxID=1508454 RepID=UPI001F51DE92|nr:hypothetical protein [Haloferax sp. ATB1]